MHTHILADLIWIYRAQKCQLLPLSLDRHTYAWTYFSRQQNNFFKYFSLSEHEVLWMSNYDHSTSCVRRRRHLFVCLCVHIFIHKTSIINEPISKQIVWFSAFKVDQIFKFHIIYYNLSNCKLRKKGKCHNFKNLIDLNYLTQMFLDWPSCNIVWINLILK